MEKPVRRKGSFRRFKGMTAGEDGAKGHKAAQDSGSGAGAWLAKGQTTPNRTVAAPHGRKYHIPATAVSSQVHDVQDTLLLNTVDSSASGDVDLDLSFDFVSKMESAKGDHKLHTVPTYPVRSEEEDKENDIPGTAQTPRGMSSADWNSRRKKPPTPLSLGRKGASIDLASQFSPESPTKKVDFDEEPLTIVPLSASKRAAQSGISNTLQSTDREAMATLISKQRTAAAQRQDGNNSTALRASPGKRKKMRTTAEANVANKNKQQSLARTAKVPLAENKAMNNAQIGRGAEQSDVFSTDDLDSGTLVEPHKRISANSISTGCDTNGTSLGHEQTAASRPRRSRQQSAQESVDSNHSMATSFKTAATTETSAGGHISSLGLEQMTTLSPSAENVLGLFYPANHVETVPSIATNTMTPVTGISGIENSPDLAQKSTPNTPFSPLFSEGDPAHASSSSGGSRTPATAVSALFSDRLDPDSKSDTKMQSSAMARGLTAPSRNIASDVIREESTLSIERPASVPPSSSQVEEPRSKTKSTRSRNDTDQSSYETENSSEAGERREMIVSTSSSPQVEKDSFDLTDVTGTSVKKGPWPQSPLLLGFGKQDASGDGVGLGLTFGEEENGSNLKSKRMDIDMSDVNVVVQRAEVVQQGASGALGLDLGRPSSKVVIASDDAHKLKPPRREMPKNTVRTSPSAASTLDGFAINVTPPARSNDPTFTRPDHRVDVPSNVTEGDRDTVIEVSKEKASDNRGRWSSKLWSVTSAFRSPTRGTFHDPAADSPPMRALTLVGEQKREESRHRRYHSRDENKRLAATSEEATTGGYHSVPSSSVIPSRSTFERGQAANGVSRPASALYTETRSSKHVHRSSRIQYVKGQDVNDHIRLEMGGSPVNNTAEGAAVEDVKSPRIENSPSGMTPRLEYLANTKSHRHSWTSNGHQSNAASPLLAASPWLAPKRESHTGARDSELYNLAANVQAVLRNAELDEDSAAVEAILGDEGLRRRNNHRSANSVPNTPVFVPEAWTKVEEVKEEHEDGVYDDPMANSGAQGPSITFQGTDIDRSERHNGRQSRYNRPSSKLSLFPGLAGLRYRTSALPEIADEHGPASDYLHLRSRRFTHLPGRHRVQRISGLFSGHEITSDIGLFAYSGKALQDASASQTLFFAGFLMMPWLWFIGGWALDDDGMVHIDHEKQYGHPEPIQSIPSEADDPYTSGRKSRNTWYGSGFADADEMRLSNDTVNFVRQSGESTARAEVQNPRSQWNDDEDEGNVHNPPRTNLLSANRQFWHRVSLANAALLASTGLRSGSGQDSKGMGGAMKRRQAKAKAMHRPEDESMMVQMARSAFDWRKLDNYVVCNRVMAILASIVIFGGFGLAIAAVIIHF